MKLQQVSVAVLGAGSWGTALAILLASRGEPTLLWGRDPEHMALINKQRRNAKYLPNIPFPEALHAGSELQQVVHSAQDLLVVVPSHVFRSNMEALKPLLSPGQRLFWATKGFESGSGKLLHQVVGEVIGDDIPTAVISGPTFATEVANDLPTALTVASSDSVFAKDIVGYLHTDTFRTYTSDDMIGVEVGGGVKNILAIAAGIADGLGYGANARAALVTRGLAEMTRLGIALGGQRETFIGLAGLGDLVLTCTDNQSRNRRLGMAIGKGISVEDAQNDIGSVVEGVKAACEVHQLATRMGVDMPITQQVYQVLYQNKPSGDAVQALLGRKQKPENA